MTTEALIVIFLGAALAVSSLKLVIKKHRIIWNKIWEIDKRIFELEKDNIEIRKELCMSTIRDARLELKMPSQHGEDLWLWNYFQKKDHGFFVEVGAYDGVTFSNTYFLEATGWHGILIEPNPENYELCCKRRPHSICIRAAVSNARESETILSLVKGDNGVDALSFTQVSEKHLARVAKNGAKIMEIKVPALKLSRILEDVKEQIDLISIDVEGAELNVLESLDFVRHAPSVFIIEDNSLGRDKDVERFLLEKGYKARVRLGANVLFTKTSDSSP
jgi:FkbM family methyltransferase